jgi:hypothetical protein
MEKPIRASRMTVRSSRWNNWPRAKASAANPAADEASPAAMGKFSSETTFKFVDVFVRYTKKYVNKLKDTAGEAIKMAIMKLISFIYLYVHCCLS